METFLFGRAFCHLRVGRFFSGLHVFGGFRRALTLMGNGRMDGVLLVSIALVLLVFRGTRGVGAALGKDRCVDFPSRLWMDAILHQIEPISNHLFVGSYRKILMPWLLRWRRMSSLNSSSCFVRHFDFRVGRMSSHSLWTHELTALCRLAKTCFVACALDGKRCFASKCPTAKYERRGCIFDVQPVPFVHRCSVEIMEQRRPSPKINPQQLHKGRAFIFPKHLSGTKSTAARLRSSPQDMTPTPRSRP